MSNFSVGDLYDIAAKLSAPRIQATGFLVEQFRFPKTKKRRIRNKWAKRPVNFRPMRGGYLDKKHNVLYVHPDILAQFPR